MANSHAMCTAHGQRCFSPIRRSIHTGIISITSHLQSPRKARIVIELLVGVIVETLGGDINASESHVVEASTCECDKSSKCVISDGRRGSPVW